MTHIRPWFVVTLLCFIYTAIVIGHNDGDPLALVTIGTRFSENIPAEAGGTEGYDGQFVYYIARDPSTAAAYIDVPAYRFQRILLPALARLMALGQEALLPWALLLIGLVSLAAGTAILENLLVRQRVSRWYALGYGLTIGTFGAVRLSLPEPLAYALVLGGILLITRERWLWAALLFALAALTRETTLLIPAGYGLYLLYQRRWRLAVVFGGLTLLPFLIWQAILYVRLGSFGIGSGGAQATSFELIPFAGVIRIFTEAPPQARLGLLLIFGVLLIPFVLLPTFWGLKTVWNDWRRGTLTAASFVLLTTALMMPFVPFSTYREPLGILRFIVGLQIAVILYAAERHQQRVLRNSTIWVVTTLFIFSLL